MDFGEVKKAISEKLGWKVRDVFYICTDRDLFDYFLVYKNHRIKCLVALDSLKGLVYGIWE